MNKAIVVLIKANGERAYFGPFESGQEATHWAFDNCKGFEWHWEELFLVNQPETETAD